jgi:hypothetical protein
LNKRIGFELTGLSNSEYLFFLFFFWGDWVSLCSLGWLQTNSLPTSATQVLGLKVCATTLSCEFLFYEDIVKILKKSERQLFSLLYLEFITEEIIYALFCSLPTIFILSK